MHKTPKKIIERDKTQFEQFQSELQQKAVNPREHFFDTNIRSIEWMGERLQITKQPAYSPVLIDLEERVQKANMNFKMYSPSNNKEITTSIKKIQDSLMGKK